MNETVDKYFTWAKWANGTGPVEDWMSIDALRDRVESEDLESDADVQAADILFIEAVDTIQHVISLHDQERWWYYPDEIAEGKYPLEKLPVHVRDKAKELYYT